MALVKYRHVQRPKSPGDDWARRALTPEPDTGTTSASSGQYQLLKLYPVLFRLAWSTDDPSDDMLPFSRQIAPRASTLLKKSNDLRLDFAQKGHEVVESPCTRSYLTQHCQWVLELVHLHRSNIREVMFHQAFDGSDDTKNLGRYTSSKCDTASLIEIL